MIPIAKPWIGEEEVEAARRPLMSGWVVQGPEVEAFEREMVGYLGAAHACAVSSGTAALHLALRAVGVGPGDEVVTVSHSFIATANAIRFLDATPVFVDIEPATYNMDPDLVEAAITDTTRAILCVHQMGMPCDLERIAKIARDRELPMIEDAACAIGSEARLGSTWEKIGRPHGDIACFSFHPRKVLTTGDGGLITTADATLDERCRSWRNHSQTRTEGGSVRYPELGFNYRMSDISAAVGRAQLARLEVAIARRRELAARYEELLGDFESVTLPAEPRWARSNWQSYCLRLSDSIDGARVRERMREAGIATLGGIMCAHREEAYLREPWTCGLERSDCECPPGSCKRLRHSEEAQEHCLILPLYHELGEEQQVEVVETLKRAIVGT